jgi:hypothetical protein
MRARSRLGVARDVTTDAWLVRCWHLSDVGHGPLDVRFWVHSGPVSKDEFFSVSAFERDWRQRVCRERRQRLVMIPLAMTFFGMPRHARAPRTKLNLE